MVHSSVCWESQLSSSRWQFLSHKILKSLKSSSYVKQLGKTSIKTRPAAVISLSPFHSERPCEVKLNFYWFPLGFKNPRSPNVCCQTESLATLQNRIKSLYPIWNTLKQQITLNYFICYCCWASYKANLSCHGAVPEEDQAGLLGVGCPSHSQWWKLLCLTPAASTEPGSRRQLRAPASGHILGWRTLFKSK